MKITSLLLADRAETRAGLLDITGGGWAYCEPVSFPCSISGFLCGTLERDDLTADLAGGTEIRFGIFDGDGLDAGAGGSRLIEGMRVRCVFALPFMFAAHAAGRYEGRLWIPGGESEPLASIGFPVRLAETGM